jgi:pyruvate-formate lyase-activating enzyme
MIQIRQESFCANPWYQLRINADGAVTYCSRGVDQSAPRASDDLHHEFNHNPHLTEARTNFLQNNTQQLKNCVRCFREENQGIDNFRHRQNFMAAIHHNQHFDASVRQSHVINRLDNPDIWPHYLFLKFGNTCSLHCRMCTPQASSGLNQLYQQHLPDKYVSKYQVPWSDDPAAWDNFTKFLIQNPDLSFIQFNGGELLEQPRFKECLRLLIHHGKTHIKITVTTNCMVYDPELMYLADQFAGCVFDLSIDTMTRINDYVRPPSQYQDIVSNIGQYLEHQHNKKFMFFIHATPQLYTIDDLHTVFDYALDHSMGVVANKVWPQRHLDFIILPDQDRARLTEMYTKQLSSIKDFKGTNIQSIMIKVINWLNLPVPEDVGKLRRQFVQETMQFDQITGSNFLDYCPQYTDFFNQYR